MYSACLTCHRDLGRNARLDSFPVGQRIAFSPNEGRVWAVCRHCGEWNLAPIEERWEAVEECRTLYESTFERGSAGGVGLGRLDDLELLFVGAGDELPTLRYGARLRERQKAHRGRRRARILTETVFHVGGAVVGGTAAGFGGVVFGMFVGAVVYDVLQQRFDPVVTKVPLGDGRTTPVTRRELLDARLVPDEGGGYFLRIRKGEEMTGPTALEAARLMLPLLTRSEEPDADLEKALDYIERKGGTVESVFAAAAKRRGRHRTARLSKLEPHIRLALEVLASREVEARAVSVSLDHLRQAWEAADELAEIQDELTYGPGLVERIRRLRG